MRNLIKKIKENTLLKKSLIDTNYYFISQLAAKLLTVLVIPILARLVSVEDFGYYDAFLLYSSFLLIFSTLGIDSGIGIFIVENVNKNKELKFYYSFSIIVGLFTILILFLVGTIVQKVYVVIPQNLFIWVFINLLFNFISYTAFNFLRWLGKSKIAAIVTFVSTTIGVLVGITSMLILKSNNIKLFITGLVAGNFVSSVICLWITKDHFSFSLIENYKQKIKDILRVSLPFLPNYLINNLLLISDRFLILNFLNANMYGYYSMISRVSQIPAFIVQVVNKGFLPVLFHNYDTEMGRKFNRKVFHIYILALIPVFVLFLIGDKFLIEVFAGAKYTTVAYLVPAIMLSVLFFGSMGFNGFGFSIKRKTLQITLITFGAVLLNVAIALLLIKVYALVAIAIAINIASGVSSIVYTWQSERLFKIGYRLSLMIGVFVLLSISAIFYTLHNF